jgi:protein-S-isoprenylcysteine O-methyltransferase Ste14
MGRRIFWQIYHLLLVLLVFWLLFAGGLNTTSSWFGQSWTLGDYTRRILIFLSSFFLFLRWGLTNFYLLKREMPWKEIIIVCIELSLIHISYAVLGGQVTRPVGIIEFIGVGLYLIGSYFNTGSELMRAQWKKDPKNKGKIYDQGLFKYSMHINYFGDAIWSTGMALISGSLWIFLVPIYMSSGFVFLHIPRLDKHLKERYGQQYEEYSEKTKKFIPFIY